MAEQYKRNPNTKCAICGKAIYKRPSEIEFGEGKAYCSQACYGKSCRKEIPCAVCGKLILSGLNKKTCSRSCANKQRVGLQYKINRPRDKVWSIRALKLRLLKERSGECERCGYNRQEILQVHHKDRNRKNNSFDNLEIICPNCHYEEHHLGDSWLTKQGGVA